MRIYVNQYKHLSIARDNREPQFVAAHIETGDLMRGIGGTKHPSLIPFRRKVPDAIWFYGSPHKIVRGVCPDIVDAQPDDAAEIERIHAEMGRLQGELIYAIERAHLRGTPYRVIKEQKQES